MRDLERARRLLGSAQRVVSFSGAGLSAESGIATFRDSDGVWSKVDPRIYASTEGFRRHPQDVSEWYAQRRRSLADVEPNAAHTSLAEADFSLHITQNVDNLLERSGAINVVHLHGFLDHDRCDVACGYRTAVDLANPPPLHTCPDCGAMVRPDVVWFGEMLPELAWQQAEAALALADVVVVIGTSGEVWPAADLISRCETVITINKEPTRVGQEAAVELIGPAASVVPALLRQDDPRIR